MAESVPLFWSVAFSITALKFLLLPSYKSTDFEVHRNWLAITHNLPFEKWYLENTSEWTLDYPPFFAWFECLLSLVAKYFDPKMLDIANLNYNSKTTLLFQRSSVIVTDFVYYYAAYKCCQLVSQTSSKRFKSDVWADERFVLCILLLGNVGLLMVDHIHFQYNGFLFGILLLAIVAIFNNRCVEAAFWFAVLLNFKHIFIYMAPFFFVYLLRSHCFTHRKVGRLNWRGFLPLRVLQLAGVVFLVFVVSFGPFIYKNQVGQVLSRLFPFKRGLSHAYWAPNFWALYNVFDKIATLTGIKLGLLDSSVIKPASLTGGLVQEYNHSVLPSIPPIATMILSAVSVMPSLMTLWQHPKRPQEFLRSLILCTFGFFLFGWHVHEKAILMIIVPFSLLVIHNRKDASLFLILSCIGHYSLFPLLYKEAELPTKLLMYLLYTSFAFYSFSLIHRGQYRRNRYCLPLLSHMETAYVLGVFIVQIYTGVVHHILHLDVTLPFLPLMITSVYCTVGVIYVWLKLSWITWTDAHKIKVY